MRKLLTFFSVVIFLFFNVNNLLPKVIKVYYYERFPYYYTLSNGKPAGILIDITKKIFDSAKIKYKFYKVPVKRILHILEKASFSCSPGWYFTKERAKIFKYTIPIYRSGPIVAIFNSKISNLPEEISLKDILKSEYSLGLISGFKYGKIIDNALKKYKPKNIQYFTITPKQLIFMVAKKRVDYTFFSEEHIKYFIEKNSFLKEELKLVKIKEIKKGELRYIICSKDVSDSIIKKLNEQIEKLRGK